jgi:hypothetical protein
MLKTLCALVLVLALCGSAFAGDMGTPPIAPLNISSPPRASQLPAVQTVDGSTEVGASAPTADMTAGGDADGFATTALSVINSLLALL